MIGPQSIITNINPMIFLDTNGNNNMQSGDVLCRENICEKNLCIYGDGSQHPEKINCDHELCLLLYAPTDIQLMNILSIAIRYIPLKFLHHPYISGNPMMADPLIPGSLFTSDVGGLKKSFVCSAFDVALLRCILYAMLLAIITFSTHNEFRNLHSRTEPVNSVGKQIFEFVMFAVVFPLIWQDIIEFTRDSSKLSNSCDFICCLIWILIVLMKTLSRICFLISSILLLNLLIVIYTYTNAFKQAIAETIFFKIEQTTRCVQPYGRVIGFSLLQFLFYICTGSIWLLDLNIFDNWRWIYEDFWDMYRMWL